MSPPVFPRERFKRLKGLKLPPLPSANMADPADVAARRVRRREEENTIALMQRIVDISPSAYHYHLTRPFLRPSVEILVYGPDNRGVCTLKLPAPYQTTWGSWIHDLQENRTIMDFWDIGEIDKVDGGLQRLTDEVQPGVYGLSLKESEESRRLGPQPPPIPDHVREVYVRHAIAEEACCPISMETFTDPGRITLTRCGHLFQSQALSDHCTMGNRECPVCRRML
jgi:hypothetical protein